MNNNKFYYYKTTTNSVLNFSNEQQRLLGVESYFNFNGFLFVRTKYQSFPYKQYNHDISLFISKEEYLKAKKFVCIM